jgi:hypothetical protein
MFELLQERTGRIGRAIAVHGTGAGWDHRAAPWRCWLLCLEVEAFFCLLRERWGRDRLVELRRERQLTCEVVAVNVATKAPPKAAADDAQGRLLRDWLWLEMARWLREEAPVFAADDAQANEDLAGELASVTLGLDSNGHLVVEDKDSMRKRLGHSPDIADAVSCTFAPGSMLPAISLAPSLMGLHHRPLSQRGPRPPGSPQPRDASPDDSVRAIQEAVWRRWSVSGYDEYDDV